MTEETTTEQAPETAQTPAEPADAAEEPQGGEQAAEDAQAGGNEAARYRRRLRAAEGERDQLRERLTAAQRREAERLVADSRKLANPADLWAGGTKLEELVGDDGVLDPAKVTVAVDRIITERPHWAPAAPDLKQGFRGALTPTKPATTWQQVVQGRRR